MAKDEVYRGTMCTVCQHAPLLIGKYKGSRYAYCTEGGPLGPKQKHTKKLMDPVLEEATIEEVVDAEIEEDPAGNVEAAIEAIEELEEESEGGLNE